MPILGRWHEAKSLIWRDNESPRRPKSAVVKTYPISTADPWHLSVQQRAPKLWQGQARPDQLDDAAESSGEPGGSASGDFSGLIGGTFFKLFTGCTDPPGMKLFCGLRLLVLSWSVGNEVGFCLVRKSPFSSWTRGALMTPDCAKGRHRSWSMLFRVL